MGPYPEQQLRRRIVLIAHDNNKNGIIEWARFNRAPLAQHELCATGTTGQLLGGELGLRVTCLRRGPLGGDQQIGARIAEGAVDILIFSGIRSSRTRATRTSRRCCGWQWPETSPSRVTARLPIS